MMVAKKTTEVRVRYAPSPTGYFHIGAARTTLFNLLFARQHNGKFILRIEDTDKERSKAEYEKEIIASMRWLGLDYDEGPLADDDGASKLLAKPWKGEYGPYRQTERLDIYERYLKQLLTEKKAYYCFCSQADLDAQRDSMISEGQQPVYSGKCRSLPEKDADAQRDSGMPYVIRIKVAAEKLGFKDMIRGEVEFDTRLIGDIVIAKNLREPLYNFAVVIDDHEMKISHVIRGEEHIANTPKQMIIAQGLGVGLPIFAHLPLILNTDRSKMSKRDGERSVAVRDYKAAGYLPEAILNFLVLLGWHPEGDQEVFTFEQMAGKFDLERVQKAGAIFNVEKLNWFNAHYIKQKSDSELLTLLSPDYIEADWSANSGKLLKVIALVKERLRKLSEFKDLAGLFFTLPEYQKEMIVWKKSTAPAALAILQELKKIFTEIPENEFQKNHVEGVLAPLLADKGRGDVLWPLRVALSGSQASPGPFEILDALGKTETLARISIAISKLS